MGATPAHLGSVCNEATESGNAGSGITDKKLPKHSGGRVADLEEGVTKASGLNNLSSTLKNSSPQGPSSSPNKNKSEEPEGASLRTFPVSYGSFSSPSSITSTSTGTPGTRTPADFGDEDNTNPNNIVALGLGVGMGVGLGLTVLVSELYYHGVRCECWWKMCSSSNCYTKWLTQIKQSFADYDGFS